MTCDNLPGDAKRRLPQNQILAFVTGGFPVRRYLTFVLTCVLAAICIFPLVSVAQKRPTRRTPAAPKPTPTPDLKVEAGQIAEQIKNFSKFIYIYGKVINGFAVADEQAREGKMTPAAATKNRESKEALVVSVRNLKFGLDNLTRSLQNNPRMQVHALKLTFAVDSAREAEQLAAAGRFDDAGKSLVTTIERLTDTLTAMK